MFQIRLVMLFLFSLGVNSDTQMLRCDPQDQSSLLRLKKHLVFDSRWSDKLNTWNSSSDCCVWDGVTCRAKDGHVIGIDLYDQSIYGGMEDSNSPLFDLHHLQLLDLSENEYDGTEIPSGIGKLVNLVHLDLSNSNFGGQVPAEISSLTSLLTLDLSNNDLKLEKPALSGLIRNLMRLTELRLDGGNMSAESEGHAWGQALSSFLPNLQVLSLRDCSLSGPLHVSLVKLQALTYIDLGQNNMSCEIPDFLAKFSNLTMLDLSDSGLYGKLPPSIFTMVTLQVLILEGNDMLNGTLPKNIGNTTTLTNLNLYDCGFSGSITDIHWENLENLIQLNLSGNALNGTIPTSIFNLHKLTVIDLSSNNFCGTFDFSNLFRKSNLSVINLSFNNLSIIESVDTTIYSSFPHQLRRIRLVSCNLKAFPSLLTNHSMESIDLSDNNIVGEIPSWIWKPSLVNLDLAHNSLIGFEGPSPNHSFLSFLRYLDLSSNLLQGQIPHVVYAPRLEFLSLSNNKFQGGICPPNLTFGSMLWYLDLSSNLLQGQICHTLFVPSGFPYLGFLSLSNNNFHGGIPPSLCYISRYTESVVELSDNLFSGTIPPCLIAMSIGVLNLKRNNLSGNIPNTFHDGCSLHTLDLSYNHLQGAVPKSMMHCKALEVINLGNNGLNDEFPFSLMDISSLRVLVLRSNKFYGPIRYETSKQASGWSKLQIIDIAANNFSGVLSLEIFKLLTGMMGNVQSKSDKLGFGSFYQDTVVVSNKGFFVELVKILTIFTTIDFSCNHFEGSIPPSIGDLTSLYALNLSHNRFTGHIPSSFGNLKGVESLDLANNCISGFIPDQLASLTFISHMNLSYNQLFGRIPTSTQLQSFPKWSYIGNKGLYGPPLDEVSCGSSCGSGVLPLDPTSTDVGKEINWKLICVEIGYVTGLGAVIGSLVFWRRWRFWFFERVDRILYWIFPRLDPNKRNHRKRA